MVLALVFVGCGGGGSSPSNTGSGSNTSPSQTAQISGAWQARAHSTSSNTLDVFVEANLTQSGTSVQSTAFLIVNSCTTTSSTSKVIGNINGNVVTLTASYNGVTANLTGTASSDGSTMAGTYTANGACGNDAGTWTAQRFPQVNGSYAGTVTSNFAPTLPTSVQGTISADANYSVTGSATLTSSCLATLTFSGTQIGAAAAISGTDNVGDQVAFTFLANDASFDSFTGTYQVMNGRCSPDTGLGILSKVGSQSGFANVSFSSSGLNFTNVPAGTTSVEQVTLTNSTSLFISISGFVLPVPFSILTNNCPTDSGLAALPPNQSCTISVAFSPTSGGTFSGTLEIFDDAPNSPQTVNLMATALAQTNPASFVPTGDLLVGRTYQTMTLLNDGKVLVAGGEDTAGNVLSEAELYDTSTGTFAQTGNMTAPRMGHTATLLNDGKVLIASGNSGSTVIASAEIYDPSSGTFSALGSTMNSARWNHTATLLQNGSVLIAGGGNSTSSAIISAELYDPTTAMFTPTGNMTSQRSEQVAVPLVSGKVLLMGGIDSVNVLASAELYDPVTGAFTATGNMTTSRYSHTATLLNNSKVLVTGGISGCCTRLNSAELYDPVTGTFTATGNLNIARYWHTGTLLTKGQVLIAGGANLNGSVSIAELYDPVSASFSYTAAFTQGSRYAQSASLLVNGDVLIAGGAGGFCTGSCSTTELYSPGVLTPSQLTSIAITPAVPMLSPRATQQFIATGTFADGSMQILQSVIWSSSNQNIATISNDATNHGVAVGVATGQTTITAKAGSIGGSIVLTVQ